MRLEDPFSTTGVDFAGPGDLSSTECSSNLPTICGKIIKYPFRKEKRKSWPLGMDKTLFGAGATHP
jgi:hypothetical protein